MKKRKTILLINGSASTGSSNERLIHYIADQLKEEFDTEVLASLKHLPHFDPAQSTHDPPYEVKRFREQVTEADGIIICTPEYVFSIPSGLKNAIEWCISTTVFDGKATGLITASASGEKAHEELQLIMRTAMATFTADTTLLINGIKRKISQQGEITDEKTQADLEAFIVAFKKLLI